MNAKQKNPVVTAKLDASGADIMARKYELPVNIVEALNDVGDKSKAYEGSLETLAENIGYELGEDWYVYAEKGDIRPEAEPVEEMRKKICLYYTEHLEHSNANQVWKRAKAKAKELHAEAEGETRPRAGGGTGAPAIPHILGNGSYEYGKNQGAGIKMYRRVALAFQEKRDNPQLAVFQTKLAEGLAALGFDVAKLEAKKKD
jgi:hypothetical protein